MCVCLCSCIASEDVRPTETHRPAHAAYTTSQVLLINHTLPPHASSAQSSLCEGYIFNSCGCQALWSLEFHFECPWPRVSSVQLLFCHLVTQRVYKNKIKRK